MTIPWGPDIWSCISHLMTGHGEMKIFVSFWKKYLWKLAKIFVVPCTLSPRSGRRDGPPHLAGALRLSPACPGSWQWVGARCAGHPSPSRGYPAHSDTDGRHTQLFQVCFNHVIFQSLNSFGFFAYEYTSWWIYFNRNDKTLLLSGSMKIEQKSGRNMRI